MTRPLIGISLDSATDNGKYSYAISEKPWYALRKCYVNAVEDAGGLPVMLPYYKSNNVREIITKLDGLLIPGGDEDINPKYYGQEIKSPKVKTNDNRAEFEFALLQAALEKDIPILGICNGLQLINVHFGGTLHQHLSDVISEGINHEQPAPKCAPTHDIIIEKNTILASLSSSSIVKVNSTHHQAIDEIGKGLTISARAPDGVIEAIELKDRKFVVGVEWHPEYLNSELDYNLFKKLVEESSKRA